MSHQDAECDLPLASSFSKTPKKVTELTHLWTIESFPFHPKDEKIESPLFSASPNDGVEWQLHLYPDGSEEETKGFISIYLHLASCEAKETSAHFTISILNCYRVEKAAVTVPDSFVYELASGFGWNRLIKRDEILCKSNFPGHTLIVRCEISYAAHIVPPTPGVSSFFPHGMPEYSSSPDFHELLESGMFSDVVFDVNGREFRAHKSVLATRSPTFKALFERNSGNTQPTRFEIKDADDHTFSELLQLIYTGKTNESYPRIRELLLKVSSAQAASGAAPSHGKNVRDTKVPDECDSQDPNERLSSEFEDTTSADISTALIVSLLESIKELRSLLNETSTSGFPKGRSETKTMEIAEGRSSKNMKLTLPSEKDKDLRDDQLCGSCIGLEEQVQRSTPAVGVREFYGDETAFFEWWQVFKVQVHDQRNLCISQKLVGLLTILEDEAEECINTMPSLELMYFATLDSLFLRYGNIEALPSGMFALLIARRLNSLTLPLRIVDNGLLMEQMDKINRVAHAPKSAKPDEVELEGKESTSATACGLKSPRNSEGKNSVGPSENRCHCRSSEFVPLHMDGSKQSEEACYCAVSIELQIERLEKVFAETPSPDSLTRQRLSREIRLTDETIQIWFQLRPINWREALHPHWQLRNVKALSVPRVRATTIGSDKTDFDECETQSLSSYSSSGSFLRLGFM